MKIASITKRIKWLAVWTATWTMLFTPVAMGAEAAKVSKAQMQNAVDELGLNRQMTIGEFYQKNKALLPERVKNEIEPFFMANKNMMMPAFEVISSKTTSGEEVPTLRISQNGELLNIQWFGEKNRMMKFQNTNLSQVDVINFDDMFTRIVAGDEKFRKQVEPISTKYKKTSANTNVSYPDVNLAQWKTMTAFDRANYIVNYRSLYQDAKAVLDSKPGKKKKYSFNIFENNPYFTALFFANDAEAKYFTAKDCVVAGYISTYENRADGREVCSTQKIFDANKSNALVQTAQAKCTSGQLACNPAIYGAPNGQPICLNTTDSNFQQATHFGGPCDTASRLQSSPDEIKFLKDDTKSQGRYDASNLAMSDEDRKKLFEKDQTENKKLTEDFLLGLLKLKKKIPNEANSLDVLNPDVVAEINSISTEFNKTISDAQTSCRTVANEGGKSENNYWPACDQLHRRFLFIQELFAKKCSDHNSTLVPSTLSCSCPAPAAPTAASSPAAPAPAAPVAAVVSTPAPAAAAPPAVAPAAPPVAARPAPVATPPVATGATITPASGPPRPLVSSTAPATVPAGASCPNPAVATVATAPAAPTAPVSCDSYGNVGTDLKVVKGQCVCPNGKTPSSVSDSNNGQTAYSCSGDDGKDANGKDKKDKNECGFFCKMWKGVKTIAPFAIAAVAGYFIFKKLAPEKMVKQPAADTCPGSSMPPPCAQTCAPPLKLQNSGVCSCDGCPPGQSPDATCTCSSGSVVTPTTILCPDSVTRAADLTSCPDYPCWNGSSYKNPMNCPTAPAGTTSTIQTNH